ncbi:hypothetical protein [Citricoccus sp. GCM10030269]|uniref:hypothetical protein n=1 Tax=Citricoccus sp. GCM10030269 TaxID=3273388 RepID=UPI00361FACD4
MRNFIRMLNKKVINGVFVGIYTACLLFAVFPPLYFWASGSTATVLWMPFAVSYWVIDALMVSLSLWALYWVESVRGELDESETEAAHGPHAVPAAAVATSGAGAAAMGTTTVSDTLTGVTR